MSNGNKDQAEREHKEMLELYKVAVSEIASFQQRQWVATNYALLLFVGLVALPRLIPSNPTLCEYLFLWLGAVATWGSGWYVLSSLETALARARGRLLNAVTSLSEPFKAAIRQEGSILLVTPEEKPSLLLLFRGVITGAFVAVSWVMARNAFGT